MCAAGSSWSYSHVQSVPLGVSVKGGLNQRGFKEGFKEGFKPPFDPSLKGGLNPALNPPSNPPLNQTPDSFGFGLKRVLKGGLNLIPNPFGFQTGRFKPNMEPFRVSNGGGV